MYNVLVKNLAVILSPAAGASVKVSVVVLTLYAVPPSCNTPLTSTINPSVVDDADSVNATVDPSPSKLSTIGV